MTDFDTSLFSKRRGRRVLFCVRGRCAAPELGSALETHLLSLITKYGLDDPDHPSHVNCRTVQCLGVCQRGPIMVVHPEAVRYEQIDIPALDRIFQEHLLHGQPVVDFMLRPLRP